jgi:hypothetical protein
MLLADFIKSETLKIRVLHSLLWMPITNIALPTATCGCVQSITLAASSKAVRRRYSSKSSMDATTAASTV